jgi:hypothetical protein
MKMSNETKPRKLDVLNLVVNLAVIACLIVLGLLITGTMSGCMTVTYKEYTPSVKCNMAIMMTEIKSKKDNTAMDISAWVNACFSELDRRECQQSYFGKDGAGNLVAVSYERTDPRYTSYLECLKDRSPR